ncbi:MAG: hypothetical protein ACYCSW_08860 [bacterium]
MKMPVYSTDSEEKHRIISELGIKYFTDNYNNLASYPKKINLFETVQNFVSILYN